MRSNKAKTKSFLGKWWYIVIGGCIGYLLSYKFPPRETIAFLEDVHDWIVGSSLTMLLIGTIATSYFTSLFKRRAEDKKQG